MEFLRIVSYKTLMSPLPLFCTLFSSGIAQMINNLAAMRETWVGSLGQEDPLEKGMATHSNIPPWRVPWIERAWRAKVHGVAEDQTRLTEIGRAHV